MVEQILPLFERVFTKCAEWTSSLLESIGGKGVLLAAFSVVLAISLLFLPMRGRMNSVSFFSDYKQFNKSKNTKKTQK